MNFETEPDTGDSPGSQAEAESEPSSSIPVGGILAWIALLGIVAGLIVLQANASAVPAEARVETGPGGLPNSIIETQLAAKAVSPDLPVELELEPIGSIRQRLKRVIVLREFQSAPTARNAITELRDEIERARARDPDFEPTATESRLIDLVEAELAADERAESDPPESSDSAPSRPKPSADDRELLDAELDWYATLLEHPPGSENAERERLVGKAMRKAELQLVLFVALAGMFLAGVVLWLAAPTFLRGRTVQLHFAPSTFPTSLLIETLVLGIVLLVVGQVVGEWLIQETPLSEELVRPVTFLATLGALLWPRLRGASARELFRAIGWNRGAGLIREIFAAFVCYVMTIPLLLAGVILTVLLAPNALLPPTSAEPFEPITQPGHPIVHELLGGESLWPIFILASIVAPIVEETLFRGLLYRHLRHLTRRTRWGLGVATSALVSSLIFAVIHPQGWVGVPVLTAIALGLCLAREWRDSLVAPMVMHGVSNGTVLLVALQFA